MGSHAALVDAAGTAGSYDSDGPDLPDPLHYLPLIGPKIVRQLDQCRAIGPGWDLPEAFITLGGSCRSYMGKAGKRLEVRFARCSVY